MLLYQNEVSTAACISDKSFEKFQPNLPFANSPGRVIGSRIRSLRGDKLGDKYVFQFSRFTEALPTSITKLEKQRVTTIPRTKEVYIKSCCLLLMPAIHSGHLGDQMWSIDHCGEVNIIATVARCRQTDIFDYIGQLRHGNFRCPPSLPPYRDSPVHRLLIIQLRLITNSFVIHLVHAKESCLIGPHRPHNFLKRENGGKFCERFLAQNVFRMQTSAAEPSVLQSMDHWAAEGRQCQIATQDLWCSQRGADVYWCPAELDIFDIMGHVHKIRNQVFGVPDNRLGEKVCSWVRSSEGSQITADDIKNWCKGKIAHYKIPDLILFKADFPRTVSGKIQKFKMKEITVEELGNKL
ncbi:unnamed protein product, partial [Meganyctiphanes norvegica]